MRGTWHRKRLAGTQNDLQSAMLLKLLQPELDSKRQVMDCHALQLDAHTWGTVDKVC
jgi:hypothetical protein